MKNQIRTLSALALAAGLGILAGCTTATTPTTTVSAPSNVSVNSLGASSIGVLWTRNSADVTADTVMAVPSDGTAMQMFVASSTSNGVVMTGLKNVTYTITVNGGGGSSSSVIWAPAPRYSNVTIYETADPTAGHPSGLDLNPADHGGTVAAVSVGASSPEKNLADVVLASDPTVMPSFIGLVSAGVTGSGILQANAKVCLFNKTSVLVQGGLDSDYYSGDLSSLIPGTSLTDPNAYTNQDFDATLSTTGTRDLIIRVKTTRNGTEHYYARLDIVRQADGHLFTTDANGKHSITVKVSESNTSMWPYAGRGTPVLPGFAPKHPAGPVQNANTMHSN